MRSFIVLLLAVCLTGTALARHGKGGVLTYEYLGAGSTSGTSKYQVTVKHYINCERASDIESSVYVGIYDAGTNSLLRTLTISKSSQQTIQKTTFDPCLSPAPTVCYVVVTYTAEVDLTDNTAGYILTEQECCRITGLVNISNSSNYGSSNYNTIPGVINSATYRNNSSAVFAQKDTAVICYNAYFELDFSATDADGDSLAYAFTSAKAGGNMQTRQPNPPAAPPYSDLPYQGAYSATQPLGSGVTINSKTGLISGTAPGTTGSYIIAVSVYEYRNGVLIGTTKKEVQVEVAACTLAAATLNISYINCESYTFTFQNESSSSNIASYYWDFGVTNSSTDLSTAATPTFTYPDTGQYTLKLKVTSSAGCTDSATAPVSVYPKFAAKFTATGSCYKIPFSFTDNSTSTYGNTSSWLWNFGDNSTATTQNASHQYAGTGTYTVTLIAGSTKGCLDTISAQVTASGAPLLSLPFKDTLICSIDTLMLKAVGTGNFSWTPAYNILNANTATPLVYPKDTTVYMVTLEQSGCVAQDSVTVNVLDYIDVWLPEDTTICRTDSIQLAPVSYALQYQWSPTNGMSNSSSNNPTVAPTSTTTYNVVANLGKCQAGASIIVKVVAYPQANAGNDTTLCYGDTAQLHGYADAAYYHWTPTTRIENASALYTKVWPVSTTNYILTVTDTLGCSKAVTDTVKITVLAKIIAYAGNDTSVIINQPLQLQASGGTSYIWQPASYLSANDIANPIASFTGLEDAVQYKVLISNSAGCTDSAFVTVRIFTTPPTVFVPTAFTPNGDGKNDVLRPIAVGITKIEAFSVYNRWGQLVFTTTVNGQGWDGKISGQIQESGAYVWLAKAVDYTGKAYLAKGSAMLIR